MNENDKPLMSLVAQVVCCFWNRRGNVCRLGVGTLANRSVVQPVHRCRITKKNWDGGEEKVEVVEVMEVVEEEEEEEEGAKKRECV